MTTTDAFANRLGIHAVVLVLLHVGRDELRRDEPHAVAALLPLTCPAVRCGAGLHASWGGEEESIPLLRLQLEFTFAPRCGI